MTTNAHDTHEVLKLTLVNNSKRPLLLLAGEIVTGGKQDRIIRQKTVSFRLKVMRLSLSVCVEP